jgi:hypothetical protein
VNTLHVMDSTGDKEVTWDPTNPQQVAGAQKIFDMLRARGYLTYAVGDNGGGTVMREFDPTAKRVVSTPRIVGG